MPAGCCARKVGLPERPFNHLAPKQDVVDSPGSRRIGREPSCSGGTGLGAVVTASVQDAVVASDDLVYATLPQRFLAFLIDSILVGLAFCLLFRAFALPVTTPARLFGHSF